jgi:hypothetical protein
MAKGLVKINGNTYLFSNDGVMRTGWKTLGGKHYYFGDDGKMYTGEHTIAGKDFVFGDDGALISTDQQIQLEWGMSKDDVKKQLKENSYVDTGNMISTGDNAQGTIYFFDPDGGLIICCRSTAVGGSLNNTASKLVKAGYKCVKKEKMGDMTVYLFRMDDEYIVLDNVDGDTTVTYLAPEFSVMFDPATYKAAEEMLKGLIEEYLGNIDFSSIDFSDIDISDIDISDIDPALLEYFLNMFA